MFKLTLSFIVSATALVAACSSPRVDVSRTMRPTPTPIKTPFVPKNGDYQGRGKVTRIEMKGGSVELDHEEIPDVMPGMKMEFFVSDKAILKGLKLGDEVNFTLRYNNGQETIIAISKVQ
jgi:Cu(I)/Ag(I) efflux system protein CusF